MTTLRRILTLCGRSADNLSWMGGTVTKVQLQYRSSASSMTRVAGKRIRSGEAWYEADI
jgi:hypothetical protein